ncbi:MAG: class I SAM-dependent methyltransferase, partial [Candidatus Binatia bacterium]
MTAIFLYIVNHSPRLRAFVFRRLFEYLARRYRHVTNWTQMNYGYAEGPGHGHTIALKPNEEQERYCHQLYLRTVNGVDLSGKDIVEVSCGRGGGAAFIYRHCQPRTLSGIDVAAAAIELCKRVHRAPGLSFLQGAAEKLPLLNETADAVINVEASLCYSDRDRFYSEVHRVLRPEGYFCYADLQWPEAIDGLVATLQGVGFDLLQLDDITANVSRALQLDSDRRLECVSANAPWFLRHAMRTFGGAPGTRIPIALADGTM